MDFIETLFHFLTFSSDSCENIIHGYKDLQSMQDNFFTCSVTGSLLISYVVHLQMLKHPYSFPVLYILAFNVCQLAAEHFSIWVTDKCYATYKGEVQMCSYHSHILVCSPELLLILWKVFCSRGGDSMVGYSLNTQEAQASTPRSAKEKQFGFWSF